MSIILPVPTTVSTTVQPTNNPTSRPTDANRCEPVHARPVRLFIITVVAQGGLRVLQLYLVVRFVSQLMAILKNKLTTRVAMRLIAHASSVVCLSSLSSLPSVLAPRVLVLRVQLHAWLIQNNMLRVDDCSPRLPQLKTVAQSID